MTKEITWDEILRDYVSRKVTKQITNDLLIAKEDFKLKDIKEYTNEALIEFREILTVILKILSPENKEGKSDDI